MVAEEVRKTGRLGWNGGEEEHKRHEVSSPRKSTPELSSVTSQAKGIKRSQGALADPTGQLTTAYNSNSKGFYASRLGRLLHTCSAHTH